MKRLSSILALFLCLTMLCTSLTACFGKKDEPAETESTEEATQSEETQAATDENGYILDDLPDSYDWEDADFNVLAWQEMKSPFRSQERSFRPRVLNQFRARH